MANQVSNTGSFVSPIENYDIGSLYNIDLNSEQFRELLIRLFNSVNLISQVLNTKETGYYLLQEMVNSSLYFKSVTSNSQNDLRPEYIKVVVIANLGAAATVPHGLDGGPTYTFTEIRTTASRDTVNNRSYDIPSTYIDGANVVVTNTTGLIFPVCLVVLKYLKQ